MKFHRKIELMIVAKADKCHGLKSIGILVKSL